MYNYVIDLIPESAVWESNSCGNDSIQFALVYISNLLQAPSCTDQCN